MNSHDENNSSDAATTGEVSTSLAPDGSKPKRRSRSNIAQLPKVLRDLINSMLDDGALLGQMVLITGIVPARNIHFGEIGRASCRERVTSKEVDGGVSI